MRRIPFKHILSRFAGLLALACLFFTLSAHAAATVTVTASAQSILGTTQTVSLTVTLIDPNTTGMLKAGAVVVTNFTATSANGTSVSIGPIFGNDVIADGFGNLNQTYYKVQVFPVSGGVIASTPALQNFYAFIGSGTIDVSTATPLSPSFQTGTNGNVVLPGTLSVTGLITASGGLSTAAVTNNAGLQVFGTTTTCTTAAAAGAFCATASINLPVGYADTNYRIAVTPTGTTSGIPVVQSVTKSNTSFTITIVAITAAAASYTGFDVIVSHN